METSWFVLQTRPQKEEFVVQHLSNMNAPTFLPRIRVSIRAGRHMQTRITPMFPGYVFVQIDLERSPLQVRFVPGVRDFIRGEGAPKAIPLEIVEALRDRIGPGGVFEQPPLHFERGDRLLIEDGPFKGLDAVFECEMSGSERVAVLLAAINLPARLVLSRHSLSRL
jgi:transcriptional antiterminator RfaH